MILLVAILGFWFSMHAATVLLARAKRYSFSGTLKVLYILVYIFGPIGFLLVFMLPDRDE